jgi:hypothetical protein
MKTPILGQAYTARSVNAADNRMINLFPEAVLEGGYTGGFLNRTPGLRKLVTVGAGPIRGLWTHTTNGIDAYVVSGSEFYKIYPDYSYVKLGDIGGGNTAPVSIADNGKQLFIACGAVAYIYDEPAGTFQQITDPDFFGAETVCYIDGYFAFNQPGTQIIWVTGILDGTSIDPLAFAAAESTPDEVVAVVSNNREVWVFGTGTTEVWYDAATTPFPLSPIQGAYNEIGCIAKFSICKLDNSLFWLGQDPRGFGIVYRNQGYTGKRISTHAIEYAIQQYGDVSDAVAYTYQQEGHSFYVIAFPTAGKTWAYDVATGAWHERAGFENGEFARHRSQCQMNFNSETIVGDYENGNLYAFDLDIYQDDGQIQKWLRSWRPIPANENTTLRTAQHSLQLLCESGVGLNLYPAYEAQDLITENGLELIAEYVQKIVSTETGVELTTESNDGFALIANQPDYPVPFVPPMYLTTTAYPAAVGYDPEVMLRWSDDGGHTWSNEHWTQIGRIGQYGFRAFWRRLGMTLKLRDRVYEVSGTDPVKIVITGADLLISPTNR